MLILAHKKHSKDEDVWQEKTISQNKIGEDILVHKNSCLQRDRTWKYLWFSTASCFICRGLKDVQPLCCTSVWDAQLPELLDIWSFGCSMGCIMSSTSESGLQVNKPSVKTGEVLQLS